MSFVKRNYIDGETVITAENLNDIQDELMRLDREGLSADVKQALLQIASKVVYIDEHGQDYYDALEAALYPEASLVSISAVYTQSGTVYDTDSLDSLKADLVVTAHFDDSSTEVVTAYTLSGTLEAGTSTITVSYGGKTTTFDVEVSTHVLFEVLNRAVDKSSACVNSGIALLETDQDFTILFDATQASAITATGNNRLLFCANSASNWKGVFLGGGNNDTAYGVQWQTGNTTITGFGRKSTNTRIRVAYRHTKNSGNAVIAYKLNNNSVVNANQTASFVSNAATLKIGGASTTTTSDNWVGTINRCTVYDTVLSDDAISAFFG